MENFNKNAYIVSGIVVAALILVGMVFFGNGEKQREAPVVVPPTLVPTITEKVIPSVTESKSDTIGTASSEVEKPVKEKQNRPY